MDATFTPCIRVLLVDDEPLLRSGLALLLGAEPDIEVVGEACDGATGVALARAARPDVVIMDLRMPVMDGVEATRELTDQLDGLVAVLILTTFDHDEQLYAALRAGATGFLLKSAAPSALAAAVRSLACGDGWLDPAVTPRLIAEFAARPPSALPEPGLLTLITPREREILAIVARGLNNAEIARELVLSEGTVKTHMGRIFMKLGLRDRAQAVALAYESGLVKARNGT